MRRVESVELAATTPEDDSFRVAYYQASHPDEERKDHYDRFISHHMADPQGSFNIPLQNPRWQFQIRLAPNQQNLMKAADVLCTVLSQYNLNYQIFKPADQNPTPGYDPVKDYDQAFTDNPNPSIDRIDRPRLGREFCVELSQSAFDLQFQYSPQDYKRIILDCVKALQDAKIKLGDLITPMDSINIPCGKDIPPFISYGYFNPSPYQQDESRHGALPKTAHNPEGRSDPFETKKMGEDGSEQAERIVISEEDLRAHQINIEKLRADGERRIQEQKDHYENATKNIEAELKRIWQIPKAKAFSRKLPNPIDLPLDPQRRHTPYLNQNDLRIIPGDVNLQNNYDAFLIEEKELTIEDFQNNPFALAFLNNHLFNAPESQIYHKPTPKENIKRLVDRDLKGMQILYLRLRHLEHEQKCLKNILIFQRTNLPTIIATAEERLRRWQPMNHPLFEAFNQLVEELKPASDGSLANAHSPLDEERENTLLDISRFVNNALPTDLQYNDLLMEENQPNNISEENRKATLRIELRTMAQYLAGKGPIWGKVLGAVLIIGGILLGALSVLTLIPSLGLSSIPGFTLAPWMVASGATFFAVTACVGVGACAYSRDTGPSKTAQMVAAAA